MTHPTPVVGAVVSRPGRLGSINEGTKESAAKNKQTRNTRYGSQIMDKYNSSSGT